MRRSLVALALAGALTIVPVAVSRADAARAGRITVIGDSVLAASLPLADRVLRPGLPRIELYAASCRGVTWSCRHPTWAPVRPPSGLQLAAIRGAKLGHTVVVELGYNDSPRTRDIQRMVSRLQGYGVHTVLWVNLSELRPQYHAVNQRLAAVDRSSAVLRVLDWSGYSRGHPGWFTDGVQLTRAGKLAFLSYLRFHLAQHPR